MQFVRAGQDNLVTADLNDGADAITSGVVRHYLKAMSGANAGKWWNGSAWAATEVAAGVGTHDARGHWYCQVDSDAWTVAAVYETYAVHAENEQINYRDQVYCLPAIGSGVSFAGVVSTEICNDALLPLSGAMGVQQIASIDDTDDPTAVICATQYPKALRKVTRIVQPHYAMSFGECGEAFSGQADWTYSFSLPDDCLESVVGYQTDEGNRLARYDHKVIGSTLLTDTLSNLDGDSAYIYYLFALSDVSAMSEAFRWAVSCELAYRLSGALDPAKTTEMEARAEGAIAAATLADSWRCRAEQGEYSWISHRGG